VNRVAPAKMDLQAHLVEKEVPVARVLPDWSVYLESGDSREGRVRREEEETLALPDPRDPLASREKEDCKELEDRSDLPAKLEIQEIPGHRVYPERWGRRE